MVYFKSFVENDGVLETKTYNSVTKQSYTCQTLNEVLKSKQIKPNTVHDKLKKRLSISYINSGYTGQYRPDGLIFSTTNKPQYCVPFDLLALANISAKKFTSNFYDAKFLDGHNNYLFNNVDEMLQKYPNSNVALDELNHFRKTHNHKEVETKTMQYNECCFENNISINPIAIVTKSEQLKKYAKQYGLQIYDSVEDYIKINGDNNRMNTQKNT